jgi:phosphoglucosamine mutase
VLLIGPIPTPGIAFITRSLRADAGIVLSASHNPYQDNGIKFFSNTGHKLPDWQEEEMEKLIFSGKIDNVRPTADDVGKAYRIEDALGRYVEFVKNSFPKGMTLDGFRIVVDCANGAAYRVAPEVYQELGAHIFVINNKPDGTNINQNAGSLHPENMTRLVKEYKADIGIAHDGDADRVILCDEKGNIVDGDYIMAIAALDMLKKGELKNETVVGTVMSNMGLEVALKEKGIKFLRTPVGDRYVLEEMIRVGANLGGEQSGHLIFSDHTTTGDGLITALQILRIMKSTGKKLSQLCQVIERYPQVLLNIRVKKKTAFKLVPEIKKEAERVERVLGNEGRLLLRYSGTEPIARVMIEGKSKKKIDPLAHSLANVIKKKLAIV